MLLFVAVDVSVDGSLTEKTAQGKKKSFISGRLGIKCQQRCQLEGKDFNEREKSRIGKNTYKNSV